MRKAGETEAPSFQRFRLLKIRGSHRPSLTKGFSQFLPHQFLPSSWVTLISIQSSPGKSHLHKDSFFVLICCSIYHLSAPVKQNFSRDLSIVVVSNFWSAMLSSVYCNVASLFRDVAFVKIFNNLLQIQWWVMQTHFTLHLSNVHHSGLTPLVMKCFLLLIS